MKTFDFDKELKALSEKKSENIPEDTKKSKSTVTIILFLTILIAMVFILKPAKRETDNKNNQPTIDSNVQTAPSSTTANTELSSQSTNKLQWDDSIKSPIKAIRLIPTNPTSSDNIKADVELSEGENKERITIKYQWLINNTHLIEGADDNTLQAGKVKGGDYVSVRVSVLREGQEIGQLNSDMILVHNTPPSLDMRIVNNRIKKSEPIEIQLISKDYDGDRVTFSLEDSPSGMTIDSATGRIIYKPNSEGIQSVSFKASAMDSQGAKTSGTFHIQIQ